MTLPDKVLICKIRKILNAEPRLLRVERYQLRWLCDVAKDSSEKIDGASAAGCKHWKASQRSAKDLMVWLHLRLDLVLAWCGASGVIRVYWKSWGIRGIIGCPSEPSPEQKRCENKRIKSFTLLFKICRMKSAAFFGCGLSKIKVEQKRYFVVLIIRLIVCEYTRIDNLTCLFAISNVAPLSIT